MVEKVKERPILFNGDMVRAILEGRKTQTRRIMKPQPRLNHHGWNEWRHKGVLITDQNATWRPFDEGLPRAIATIQNLCSYGKPGDRLWVRETWQGPLFDEEVEDRYFRDGRAGYENPAYCVYKASGDSAEHYCLELEEIVNRWRPSIHMPRWASRITLEITGVRAERLHDISEQDAIREGVQHDQADLERGMAYTPTDLFLNLWESINGKESVESNPCVWVLEFKVVEVRK